MITFMYEVLKRAVSLIFDTANDVDYVGAVESITRSGGTATVTKNNHGFTNGQSVTVAGADLAAYNGVQTVGGATANTFTYAVAGTPATPATGNLTVEDKEQSLWTNLPEAIHVVSIAGATTVKLEVSISLALGWQQLGADLTSADNGKTIALDAKYNFVRLRRSAGVGAVVAYAQL